MDLPATTHGAVVVVHPAGRIDHSQAAAFHAALQPYVARAAAGTPLVIDLAGLEYIASVGLRELMLAARAANAPGAIPGSVAVAAPQPAVREVFAISRFHLVIAIHDDVATAVAAVAAAAQAGGSAGMAGIGGTGGA